MLDGLPIEFVSGQLGLVQAQVDWPLSFSSGVRVKVDTININLKLKPSPTTPSHSPNPNTYPVSAYSDPPSDPISAAASEFVHDELDAFEDAELRASLVLDASTSDMGASFRLPGAFGGAAFSPSAGDESPQDAGQEVTLLAGLLAGLLARLKVEVTRVRVRLVLPANEGGEGGGEIELVVDSVRYADEPTSGETGGEAIRNKTVRISPPQVRLRLATPLPRPANPSPTSSDDDDQSTHHPSPSSSRHSSGSIPTIPSIPDLSASAYNVPPALPSPPPPLQPPASSPPPAQRYDSDSSDESDVGPEHDMMMWQSIADMRSSFVSARSGGESMYASALGGTIAASRMDAIGEGDSEEDESPFVDPETGSPLTTGPEPGTSREATPPVIESQSPPEDEPKVPTNPPADDFRTILSFGNDELVLMLSSRPFVTTAEPPQAGSLSPSQANSPVVRASPLPVDPFASSPEASPSASPAAAPTPLPALPLDRRSTALPLHITAVLAGPVSILLLPAQLAALVRLGAVLSSGPDSRSPATPRPFAHQPPRARPGPSFSATIKAIHIVIGLSPTSGLLSSEQVGAFFAHPGASAVPLAHLRLKLEGLTAAARPGDDPQVTLRTYAVTELLFDGSSRPLIVSDANVARQYDLEEAFPTFDAADWVGDKPFEARGWRTRPGHVGRSRRVAKEADRAAITVNVSHSRRAVALGPVRLFLDLTILHRLQPLVDYLSPLAAAFETAQPPPRSPTVNRPRPPRPIPGEVGGQSRNQPPLTEAAPSTGSSLAINCELIRVSIRVPSPAGYSGSIRSGIVKVDVHALGVHVGTKGSRVETQRVGVFFLPAQAHQAVGFLSLTPLARLPHGPPSITLPSASDPATTVQLPLLRVRLTKPILDCLQLFADDLGQWSATRAAGSPTPTEIGRGPRGGDAKILGSAYFGASRQRGGSESSEELSGSEGSRKGGKKVEVRLSELMVDLLVEEEGRGNGVVAGQQVRRMRARGTDLEVHAQLGAKEEVSRCTPQEFGSDADLLHYPDRATSSSSSTLAMSTSKTPPTAARFIGSSNAPPHPLPTSPRLRSSPLSSPPRSTSRPASRRAASSSPSPASPTSSPPTSPGCKTSPRSPRLPRARSRRSSRTS